MTEHNLRDCTEPATWWPHVDEAVRTLSRGALAVIPTDTVYGIAADAFTPDAVDALLAAKGRGRQMPPPVLIGDVRTLDGLAIEVPQVVRDLVERFWPGALTVILPAQPSLMWDLGETEGTVALRMPDEEFTLALLRKTGPLAVSSANRTGQPAALSAAEAAEQLGSAVSLYLDGGPATGQQPSTIVDATGERLRIVRQGAISAEELAQVAPELAPEPAGESDRSGDPEPAPISDTAREPDNQ
ncbi:L-threonylcarbamoyladenylate synthase [Pseudactinotalea sp. Z1748]|uniref:L-threonylcarbamoyladenylate synthase n=1 Tax=Pseudactinotalea sp. Z1748 TaxID=3413027 RepID=UPI003C7A86F3